MSDGADIAAVDEAAPAAASAPPDPHRPFVVAAVMLSMAMVAIEATIVSTAMPQIVGQLGGLTSFSWVFSGFLLAQTVATMIFGRISDLYGRKPAMLGGIGFFLLGSILCGLAWSMPSLIAFRLLQGIGAGAIQPVALTIVGDLYSARERGRVQGALASVWAVSAVLGPLVGAVIVEHLSWAWIFWMNVPFGILGAAGFVLYLREEPIRPGTPSDILGALIFTVGIGALMVGLGEAGHAVGPALAAGALFLLCGVAFVWQERRAAAPIVAFELWTRRAVATCTGVSLLAGMALIGLTTFLPIYVQGILHGSPVVAGLALTAMVLGWPIGATVAARVVGRFGLRRILIAGSAFLALGGIAFPLLGPGTPPAFAGLGSFVMGLGMGLLSTASIVMVQEIVAWQERGSATASLVFSRNLGSTLGAALFGAVLNAGLARSGVSATSDDLQRMLAAGDADAALAPLRASLQGALHATFWAVFLIAAATVVIATLVPHVALGRKAPAD